MKCELKDDGTLIITIENDSVDDITGTTTFYSINRIILESGKFCRIFYEPEDEED